MLQMRVSKDDLPAIKIIYDALADAIEAVPASVAGQAKFGLLAMMAIINIACRVAMKTGVCKVEFMRSVDNIWDSKAVDAPPPPMSN